MDQFNQEYGLKLMLFFTITYIINIESIFHEKGYILLFFVNLVVLFYVLE